MLWGSERREGGRRRVSLGRGGEGGSLGERGVSLGREGRRERVRGVLWERR